MFPRAILKRERSSDGSVSVGDPAVVTEPEPASEAEDTKGGDPRSEPPLQPSEASADDENAPTEVSNTNTTTPATEDVGDSAGTNAQIVQAEERNPELIDAKNSDVEDTRRGEDMEGHKDQTLKEEDEKERRLPLVATDITLATFRAGEKVTRNACFCFVARHYYVLLTCGTLSYTRHKHRMGARFD